MKSIIISGNGSGSGKTTVTLGLMRSLMNKGFNVQPYKVGPDYIDPAFHSHITGNKSRNLDIFLAGEEGIKAIYARGAKEKGEKNLGIIEGVMGLYDGKGIDTSYSTAHVAKTLKLPVILVLSPKAQSATLCSEINGIINYEDVNIAGVILNNISESYYKLLKVAIEKNCNTKVFGFIPKDDRLSIGSRHLGLIQSSEIEDLEERINYLSSLVDKYVDVEGLLNFFKETKDYEDNYHLDYKGINISIAFDKAFSFYYEENIELLKEVGKVKFFSPIKDEAIPKDTDFLYIGGGYPEVFKEELSNNKSMLNSIKSALEAGVKCYAECGGLMYLCKSIEGSPMVGFFDGSAFMSNRLQNFGYADMKLCEESPILNKGLSLHCHEFHRSYVELKERKIYELTKNLYDGSVKKWNCGYAKNNTLAGYPHVHFFSNLDFIKELLK